MGVVSKLWNSRPIVLVRGFFELYGIVTTAWVLAGSGIVTLVVTLSLDWFWNLPPIVLVVLVVAVFLLVAAVILTVLNPVLQHRVSYKRQLESTSTKLRLVKAEKESLEERLQGAEQERDELRAKDLEKRTVEKKIKELNAETERFKAEIVRQQEQLNRYDADSLRFRQFLIDAWSEGTNLCGKNPTQEAAEDWAGHVRNLLERAMAKHIAYTILAHDPQFQSADPDASGAQKFLEMRVQRLENLRKTVANRDAIPLRSGFDPHEWKDWKSPPSTDSEEVEQLKARLREVERERDELRSGEWRQRVENWEAVILDFDFHTDNFASTGTYFDMEEYLKPEVVEMFKGRTFRVGNEAHGDSAYKPALLREIARIKRERGII
jgi:hypothetical protein